MQTNVTVLKEEYAQGSGSTSWWMELVLKIAAAMRASATQQGVIFKARTAASDQPAPPAQPGQKPRYDCQ